MNVKVSTQVPAQWADELDRLATVPIDGSNGPVTKAGMIRNGIRMYLQHRSPERWEELDLGPQLPGTEPPPPVIDVESEEIPVGDLTT